MPSKKQNPQAADLTALLKSLCEAGIEFIVVGGLAAVVQGAPVTTFDLDIVHQQTDQNVRKLFQYLKSVDAFQRRPDDKIIVPTEESLKEKGHILLYTQHGPLDVLAFIEKGLMFNDLLKSTIEIEFHGFKVNVLRLDTMIDLKRGSQNPKDRYRVPILEETLRQIQESRKK